MSLVLSPGQSTAFDKVSHWYHHTDDQEFVLAGYAGTGKSTLADSLNKETGGAAKFVAYTGKAANVLREKGCDATTIHKALYKPVDNDEVEEIQAQIDEAFENEEFDIIDELKDDLALARLRADGEQRGPRWALDASSSIRDAFVIVDEYSMVPEDIRTDLRKLARKILYLGDPEQLPPVNGKCVLQPNEFLTEIHRQALDSPIIRYATAVREGRKLEYVDEPGFLYQPKRLIPPEAYTMAEQIIVGRNATRIAWNNRFRMMRGIELGSLPQPGEKMICLKNNPDEDLFNGMIVRCAGSLAATANRYVIEAEADGQEWPALNVWMGDIDGREEAFDYRKNQNLNRFDFSSTITCHKSQGSEFDNVLIYDEPVGKDAAMCRRWRYTAISRAKNRVVLVDPN